MMPDLTITRFKSHWKYVIQRFAGGTYTLQAIETMGEPLDEIAPRRFVNLGVYPTEADADDAMQNMIRHNPSGTMDQALPYWILVEIDEGDPVHRGSPVINTESVRELQRQKTAG